MVRRGILFLVNAAPKVLPNFVAELSKFASTGKRDCGPVNMDHKSLNMVMH